MIAMKDASWYRSKAVLDKLKGLTLVDTPHLTPDGYAVMVLDMGGTSVQPVVGGDPARVVTPPMLVVQAGHGHDLLHAATINGQPGIARVEFAPADVADLEPLVEYDHLPDGRKDYSVYPKGHKLA